MVGEDLDWEGGAVKVVSEGFESANYGEEFAVIDVVVSFCLRERLGKVGTGVPIAVRVGLEEYSSGRRLRGIGGDGERCGEIWEMEDWFRQEEGFEGVEGFLAGGGPVPLEVFLGEVDEGAGDVRIVGNESSVEIGKAKERAYVFYFCGGWPFGDSVKFDGVHSELTRFDDHSKVVYFTGGEFTLLEFEVEIQLGHSLEDSFGVFFMVSGVRGEDEEVVHIDNEPTFCDHISKGVVHKSLESGRGVGEAKEHDGWFEEAFMSDEGGFPLMSVFDADVVVAPSDIEFCEDFGVSELVDKIRG